MSIAIQFNRHVMKFSQHPNILALIAPPCRLKEIRVEWIEQERDQWADPLPS